MLNSDTKRRVNTCRDILVGKVPDPKSQVEQITIALIYKFMDDMDLQAEEMGGVRSFFTGEYERYAWAKLVAPGVGGQEMLNTYSEALTKMVENDQLPELFRSIFRNAYLPYRDPETLRSFLREINGFSYDHSERLGDAFEYLLSVLGSQGDAGQFRTPRHIIDFMVEIIDPKKEEVILDPACGTAGFLISSYKHILKANSTEVAPPAGNGEVVDAAEAALESPLRYAGDLLTPEDRKRLADNIKGYDISPDMVRLSLVNLYLHGFADPKMEEYDTLTSEDKWGQTADVILANPPFMSPKGGIKPHNRFQVQSKRSEVLFVDYIAEHLNLNGRAAIIVPEGIIFQSQSSYCELRKMLVDKFLVAVISLPAGVFNPYSGVKTSILILDRAAAKASDSIAFFKIENDGFGLGAQRRAVKGGQLGQVKAELGAWLTAMRGGGQAVLASSLGHSVGKDQIGEDGQYNLSGERYRVNEVRTSTFPMLRFDDVCTLEYGSSLPKPERRDGPYPVMGSNGVTGYHDEYLVEGPSIVVGRKGSAGEVTWVDDNCYPIDTTYYVKQRDPAASDLRYLYSILRSLDLPSLRGGAGIPGLNRTDVYEKHQIPLPPLEVQREIVTEIEGCQKIIDGARIVLENYRPHIPIDPAWEIVEVGDIGEVKGGKRLPKGEAFAEQPTPYPYIRVSDLTGQTVREEGLKFITEAIHREITRYVISSRDIYISIAGTIGLTGTVPESLDGAHLTENAAKIVVDATRISNLYLAKVLAMENSQVQIRKLTHAVGVPKLALERIRTVKIPLPPIETQQAIVAEIEAEQALVAANRDLITRFEKKIESAIARVWGRAEATTAEVVAVDG